MSPRGRAGSVGLLLGQAASRVPELVPVRHGRMLVSPFTFYRGARCRWRRTWRARPRPGCGCSCAGTRTCPISARSPRRSGGSSSTSTTSTRPCPAVRWDVKRLAATWSWPPGTTGTRQGRARSPWRRERLPYRDARVAAQTFLDVWYAHLDIGPAIAEFRSRSRRKGTRKPRSCWPGPHRRQHEGAGQAHHHGRRAASDRRRPPDDRPDRRGLRRRASRRDHELIRTVLGKYRRTLQSDRRHLLEQFTMVQVARKVVGVGSVGTGAWVVLMDASDGVEPLFRRPRRPSRRCWRSTAAQPVQQPGRAGGRRAAPAAGPERHLPRLDRVPDPSTGSTATSTSAS